MSIQGKSSPQYFKIEKALTRHAYNMPGGHMHSHHELYYLIEGERRYFIDGQIYTVHEGDVVIIPKSTLHHTTSISSRQHVRYLVEFGDEFIHESIKEQLDKCFLIRHFSLTAQQRQEFEHILEKLDAEQSAKSPFGDAMFHAYTTELLVMLIRQMDAGKQEREKPKTQTEQLIEAATDYISDNLQGTLTLTHVASEFHLSPSYFSRIFKAYTGFGFNEYITHLRVQKATQLLLNTSAPISEIAYLCGYSDSNYFSSVFKKDTGISPKKYRMQK